MKNYIIFLCLISVAFATCKKESENKVNVILSNPDSAKIIFLHHSTGNNVWSGGVKEWIENYNTGNSKAYDIEERAFPDTPWPWANYPSDYYRIWINNEGINNDGTRLLENLTTEYNVIIFKHCFPGADILEDEATTDPASEYKSLANYKAVYSALKTKMNSFSHTCFIVWTGAALTEKSTNESNARRMQQFVNWVKNEWDIAGDNIFIWDFYSLETQGSLYMKTEFAASETDSHPNAAFCETVAPYFSQRIVEIIQGKGDTKSRTGQ